METAMEIVPYSSELLDLETICSRTRELENMLDNWNQGDSESENFLGDCALNFKRRVEEMVSEWSCVGFSDDKEYESCMERLSEELSSAEAASARMSEDIEALSSTQAEDFSQLETELESLKCLLDVQAMENLEAVKHVINNDFTSHGNNQSSSVAVSGSDKLQLLELENEIQKKNLILKSLEDLDCIFKWFDVTEHFENSLTGLKVIALDGNCIRLSLQTYIPVSECLLSQQTFEKVNGPIEVKHELLIEVLEGTMDQNNVEIFPNDVYINNVFSATKDFSKSSLQWLVTKVQDRIVLCTMRQLVVKSANKSGHSLEYLDKDEMMVAHLAMGVDAFVKIPQGWPISSSSLKLTSIKNSDRHTKEFSRSFLSKVKVAANSLEANILQNLSGFVDKVEEILEEQKQIELASE